jgi:hypothetical protein
VAYQDDGQARTHPGLGQRSGFTGNLRANLACDLGAVENGGRHQLSSPSLQF